MPATKWVLPPTQVIGAAEIADPAEVTIATKAARSKRHKVLFVMTVSSRWAWLGKRKGRFLPNAVARMSSPSRIHAIATIGGFFGPPTTIQWSMCEQVILP